MNENIKIAVIGLGYVGLPLARLFATKFPVVGFDINAARVEELKKGHDSTLEVEDEILKAILVNSIYEFKKQPTLELTGEVDKVDVTPSAVEESGLFVTRDLGDISDCNYYIITVPTPIDKNNRPDLTPLYKSSESVAKVLKKGDIVIYESTVYPGVTEDECVPVLEKHSGLKFNEDFFVGYSPERINPGDKEHTVEKILKVTAGSTPEIGKKVDKLYKEVITAGTHLAPTIKVAEAAKVIENSQRDINIAFVNELAKIFNKMNIDTQDVLEAAGTKWNFLPFKPGLVGGHCIGVDPYYLAQKAQELGYHPEIILAGRRMNDSMGKYVAGEVIKLMLQNDLKVKGADILVMGITFKENCPDVRNTKVVDVVKELQSYGTNITIYDPLANPEEVKHEYGLQNTRQLPKQKFSAVVLTVAHKEFLEMDLEQFKAEKAVVYDVKGVLEEKASSKL
ncbi:UDP-N-acetyl-D-galactosamine dehydrogenase [Salegentibacter salinarum]|uniref:UDP-N-acetyl-D-galactosamine dehydrogenase n=1 Tax=Salegentibacter salinarum TaxID=447422 RepID=A0A2N0TXJ6_9FLAO|nr:nucleotide sugar dehydrogenase [Salegentibacter salinarum]PKD19473.1 UDP-N-acetyl-D-galactosamine dehydrogenase [Salegentibacter salinarum]SKB91895.1 UDP-N-acetyl-D-galactosamine dehydrogenase [Salegentibacter salinarum]